MTQFRQCPVLWLWLCLAVCIVNKLKFSWTCYIMIKALINASLVRRLAYCKTNQICKTMAKSSQGQQEQQQHLLVLVVIYYSNSNRGSISISNIGTSNLNNNKRCSLMILSSSLGSGLIKILVFHPGGHAFFKTYVAVRGLASSVTVSARAPC